MEKHEINSEDEKEYEYEARQPKKRQRVELVFKNVVQPIEGVEKIEDLIKRVNMYFKFTPKKLMFSHKGLVHIFDQTDWPETKKEYPDMKYFDKKNSEDKYFDKEMKLFMKKRQKNNEDFFHSYLEAISGKRKKPLRIKVFEDEEAKCDDDLWREDSYGCPIQKSTKLSKKETKKIKFTYLDQVVEDLKINLDEIKDFEGIIKFLNNKLIEKFLDDIKHYEHLLNDK